MSCTHKGYRGVTPPKVSCKSCRMVYTARHWDTKSTEFIAEKLKLSTSTVKSYGKQLGLPSAEEEVRKELKEIKTREQLRKEKARARARDKIIISLEESLSTCLALKKPYDGYSIISNGSGKSEATAVIQASDWHIEETVTEESVNGMNLFNEEVCFERVRRFWRHSVKLLKQHQRAVNITSAILHLGGDFISNTIHADLAETNRLLPADAIIEARMHLSAGIKYLLAETDLEDILVVCSTGNHGRMTAKQRVSSEDGNSLEKVIYHSLAQEFSDEDRISFDLRTGYHKIITLYDSFKARFHHGHWILYAGGIGGITIPANKAIAGWNNKFDYVDVDVFGHYHQHFNAPYFNLNGSLIGYNPFALKIKAKFEPPTQAFFLIDKNASSKGAGITSRMPIILDRDR